MNESSYYWQYLTVAAVIALMIAWLSGAIPTSADYQAVTSWLWGMFRWGVAVAALLSTLTVAWYAPVLWRKRRVALAEQDTELALLSQKVSKGNLELANMKAEIVGKLSQVESTVQRNQAEIRQMNWRIESLTANKSILAIDTSHDDPFSTMRLINHPPNVTPTGNEPTPTSDELRLIDDVLLSEPRFLLIGGMGTGKTNTTKHYLNALVQRGARVTVVDPHSPSKLLGVDCIGAGLNFEQIAHFMIQTMLSITKAYQSGNIRQDGDFGNDNHYLIVDEYADIVDNVGEDLATQFLRCLLIRGRKAGYRFCLISQSDSVTSLGIKGDSALLDGAQKVELKFDRRNKRRWANIGWKKADQYQATVPPLFGEFVTVPDDQLNIEKPRRYNSNETALAKTLITLNGDAGKISNNEIIRQSGLSINSRNKKLLNGLL